MSDLTPVVLGELDWAVRSEIYRVFADAGSAPILAEIGDALGVTVEQVRDAFRRLEEAHEIASLPDLAGVWMANPFSGVPTDFVVETPRMKCYANCAWDALGVPAILDDDGWTRTRCANSDEHLEFGIRKGRLEGQNAVIHLVTPIRDAWVDIGFT